MVKEKRCGECGGAVAWRKRRPSKLPVIDVNTGQMLEPLKKGAILHAYVVCIVCGKVDR